MHMHVEAQERVLNPLELSLQMLVSSWKRVMATQPQSFAKAVGVLSA